MSFSSDMRTLTIGKSYSSNFLNPKMSVSAENTTDTSTPRNQEGIKKPNKGISHKLIEERIKANLGPLNEQISTLNQLLNQLTQERSARNSQAADIHTQLAQPRRSSSSETGTSRALSGKRFGSMGSPPGSDCSGIFRKSLLYNKTSLSTFRHRKYMKFSVNPSFDRNRCFISPLYLCMFYPSVSVGRLARAVLVTVLPCALITFP